MARSAVAERSAQNQTVSQRVVSAVAEETGSDPMSLQLLYDAIDPDALDALFETAGNDGRLAPTRVEFTYCGCDVVVSADGTVTVSERERET